jgi:hypothetical protein
LGWGQRNAWRRRQQGTLISKLSPKEAIWLALTLAFVALLLVPGIDARSKGVFSPTLYEFNQTTVFKPYWPPAGIPVRQPGPLPILRIEPDGQSMESVANGKPAAGLRAYSKDEVAALIRHHSASVGISPGLALRIASCESGYRHDAANKSSSARGVFQYLAGTWANTSEGKKGTSVFDADANIRMAVTHIAVHGTAPWNESKGCWGK